MLLGAIGYKQKVESVSFHFNETIQWMWQEPVSFLIW